MANTWIVPGRHMDAALETPEGNVGQPADAIPFAALANSCCIFDRRLWHSATPNWSQVSRKVLFLGYAWRWTQSKDPMFTERALAAERCPITKQMLGATTSNAGLYAPTAADTPLRLWLQHHGVDEPLGTGALARDTAWAGRGDGLAPLPATIRELEAGGVTEGDVGHTTFSRAADKLWTRGDVAPADRTASAQRDGESRAAPKATARM